MAEYPIDFGTGYKVQTVYANKLPEGGFGDIYDFRSEVEREHPGAEILTGYCVIDVGLGLIPNGCNDWNNLISDAIQDYEDHIVPVLQREEPFALLTPVYNEDGELLYSVEYTAKVGWLEDYFGVDNYAQLEVLWDVSEAFEDEDTFRDAMDEAEVADLQITGLVRDNVKVSWAELGEGLHGDYDPMNPDDVELLRFDVFVMRNGEWEEKENASYCTNFPVSSTIVEKFAGLQILLDRFHEALSADIDVSVKKLGEEMSWIDSGIVAKHIKKFGPPAPIQVEPEKPNVTDNLIKAMVAYGLEYNWSDSDIIEALVDLGVTHDDFCHAGAQDFVKDYFAEPHTEKSSLNDRIHSAAQSAEAQSDNQKSIVSQDLAR